MKTLKDRFQKLLPTFRFLSWAMLMSTVLQMMAGWLLSTILQVLTGPVDSWASQFPRAYEPIILWFLLSLLGYLIWSPFLAMMFVRRSQEIARERQALQARFDAEDKLLFGDNCKLN